VASRISPKNSDLDSPQFESANADRCFSEVVVATLLDVSVAALRKWRRIGGGPPYLRIGKLIRYRFSDLKNFMDSRTVTSTSERGR
jgi:hypothetical protein